MNNSGFEHDYRWTSRPSQNIMCVEMLMMLNITLHKNQKKMHFQDLNRINLDSYGLEFTYFQSLYKRKNRVGSITVLDSGSGYKNKEVKVSIYWNQYRK